jgi:NAD(P)-dependent dehydrogenase (short-subunit alcohol dehydrogenase family)
LPNRPPSLMGTGTRQRGSAMRAVVAGKVGAGSDRRGDTGVGSPIVTPPGLPFPPPLGTAALPDGTYDGSVVVVTGGGTGLGKAIATEFARLGATVGILSRDEGHRRAGVAAVEAAGGRAVAVACDIRQADSVAAAFDLVEAQAGPIDVLINNAAGNFPVPAEDMSPNAWRTVVDIVLNGTFLCCRDLARRLIPPERDGAVVNVGASYAWTGGPGFAHSAAAKAGVKNLTETLAVEWAPYGIRVNGLVPGLMPHEDETAAIAAVPGKYEGQDSRVPAGRVGFPRELAWAATFLCSPYAAYISGHTMVVDGANWQRRHTVQPPFVPIRQQLDRPPFGEADGSGRGRPSSPPSGAAGPQTQDPRTESPQTQSPPTQNGDLP